MKNAKINLYMKIMLALFILIVLSCSSQSGKNNIEEPVLSLNNTSQTTKDDFNSIKTGDTYELIM